MIYDGWDASHQRSCIPAFQQSASMAVFLVAIQAETEAAAERWRARIATGAGGAGATVDLYAEARRIALDVVLRVTSGLAAAAVAAILSFARSSRR
mmetsp:Transcript_17663/g.57754  ORF Transcript_17663/g.57754 Transcript_17663/m.57754 type:complete len:96 (+) Transcript_17663:435-722(+)